MEKRNAPSEQLWFYALICLAAFLFGGLFQPGEWYAELNRAPWTPPNLAFPIVWSILYVCIAYAGYLTAKNGDPSLFALWFIQIGLNAAWSWVFFGQHWATLSLIDITVLALVVLAFIIRSASIKAWPLVALMSPYLMWLLLATSLNAYIVIHN